MKFFENRKLKQQHKSSHAIILKKGLFRTPAELKTICTSVTDKEEARNLATYLVNIAKRINKSAGKMKGLAYCCGLAANQVGITKRVFIIQQGDGTFKTFINPVIIRKEGTPHIQVEQCFSTNFKKISVKRWPKIVIKADGITQKKLSGLQAIAFQHEYDHLEGII